MNSNSLGSKVGFASLMAAPTLLLTLLTTSCTKPVSADVKEVMSHETFHCAFPEVSDIVSLLEEGHTKDELISALKGCAGPKYQRGDVLQLKSNKNCTFKVYFARLSYVEKPGVGYVGSTNCNGIISDASTAEESDLVPLKKTKLRSVSKNRKLKCLTSLLKHLEVPDSDEVADELLMLAMASCNDANFDVKRAIEISKE